MKNIKTLTSQVQNTERKARKDLEKQIKKRGAKCIVKDEIKFFKTLNGKYKAYVKVEIV